MNKRQKQFESIIPGSPNGTRVVSFNGRSDLSFALRRWKKMVKDDGIIDQLKARQEFEKPTSVRRKQRERGKFLAKKATERYS